MTNIDRPGRYDWPHIVTMVGLLSLAAVSLAMAVWGVMHR